jgi:tagatose-6-phosphate ketose/aldose isomerase
MTSSFSNLTLAGMAVQNLTRLSESISEIAQHATSLLPQMQKLASELAGSGISRVVILGSGPLVALGSEAALKILEMTAGQTVAIPESYLGLRHGPMSFLRKDTLVLCVASSSPAKRRYEVDLLNELRSKKLGRIVAIADQDFARGAIDAYVPPIAPSLPDALRTPFEIPFAQLLAYSLSMQAGLDPDNPSPEGVITRVVQSFKVYEDEAGV